MPNPKDLYCTSKVRLKMALEKSHLSGQPVIRHRNGKVDLGAVLEVSYLETIKCVREDHNIDLNFCHRTQQIENSFAHTALILSHISMFWNVMSNKSTRNICCVHTSVPNVHILLSEKTK